MKKSEMTKKRIIDATRQVYFEEGYQALSIRRISEVSKVAIGNIYYYYDHKEVLIEEMMASEWKGTFEKCALLMADLDSAEEKLKIFMRILNEDMVSRNGLVLYVMKERVGKLELRKFLSGHLNKVIFGRIESLLTDLEDELKKKLGHKKYMMELVLLEIVNSVMQPDNVEDIITCTFEIILNDMK